MKKTYIPVAAILLSFSALSPIHRAFAAQDSKSMAPSASAPVTAKQRAEADIKLGDLATKNGSPDEAIGDYKAAIEADPANRDAHEKFDQAFGQKLISSSAKKPAKKNKKLSKAEQEKKNKEAEARRVKLGAKLLGQEISLYDRWIKKYPRVAMVYWGKGNALDGQKNAEAKALFQQAISIDPSCAPAYQSLSNMAAVDGDVDAQRYDAEKALALDPKGSSGVFFNYVLTYLSTDPPKYRQLVEDRVAKYPEDLEYLLALVAENAATPQDQAAVYEQLYKVYGPKSAHPVDGISDMMVSLFNLYAKTDPAKALTFAQQMQKDETDQLAKKAAADEKNGDKDKNAKKTDAKPQKPLWQSVAEFQKILVDAQSLVAQKKYADAQALLAQGALKPKNDFDPLSSIDLNPYNLAQGEALAESGQTQKAYDAVKTALLPRPDDALQAALVSYGAKLGKTPDQVDRDIWLTRESKAKPMMPFDLKQYVTDKNVKLADYRGQVVLVNFWFPG